MPVPADDKIPAHPGFAVDRTRFVRFIAARLRPGEAAATLHLIDLYLACACLDHDPRALATFEREQLAPVAGYLARIDRSRAFVDDVRQTLRAHLIVGVDGRGPRLARYSGRGTLAAWMRVCAVRTALNLRRTHAFELDAANDAVFPFDAELALITGRIGPEFRDAFTAALAALTDDDRAFLRLHFLEDLSFTQLSRIYGLERSTIARRVAAARQRLRDDTAARLRQRLGLDADDIESLLRSETFFSTIAGSLCLPSER